MVFPLKSANCSLILLVELAPRSPAALSREAWFLTFGSSSEKMSPSLQSLVPIPSVLSQGGPGYSMLSSQSGAGRMSLSLCP